MGRVRLWVFALGLLIATAPSARAEVVAMEPRTMRALKASNVREAPSLNGAPVGRLAQGQEVTVNGRAEGGSWLRVVLPEEGTGFVWARLLKPAAARRGAERRQPDADKEAGDTYRDCPACPVMVVLPTGAFTMGAPEESTEAGSFERPAHRVTIDHALAMGRTEVTRRQWRACVRDGGCDEGALPPARGEGPDHPAHHIAWTDARAYVRWLAERTGAPYRLPTEAEWEYAARAGTETPRPWTGGAAAACDHANVGDRAARATGLALEMPHPCDDGVARRAPVGRFGANGFGLQDMIGNVAEWVLDCPSEDYTATPANGSPFIPAGCDLRVVRGGAFDSPTWAARAAARAAFPPNRREATIGFRVVKGPEP